MKHLLILTMTLFLLGTVSTQVSAQSDRDQYEIQVDGLGCPFCAYGLEKKFKEFKGIKDVKIEMETGVFTFSYPDDKALSTDQVEKQVEAAGYTAVTTKITRTSGEVETSAVNTTELSAESKVVEKVFFVAGNCGMCEARIEKAANSVEGVTKAEWNSDTNQLVVSFDAAQTTKNAIEEAIAKSGHDTKSAKADGDTYDSLPGCCQYDRMK